MVRRGMVEELKEFYDGARGGHARVEDWECSRGIGKAIGVAEFGRVFRGEGRVEEAVREMKENTARLAAKQRGRIGDLRSVKRWRMERVDATQVFRRRGEGREVVEEEWRRLVVEPSAVVVARFLRNLTVENGAMDGGLRLATLESAIAASSHLQYV